MAPRTQRNLTVDMDAVATVPADAAARLVVSGETSKQSVKKGERTPFTLLDRGVQTPYLPGEILAVTRAAADVEATFRYPRPSNIYTMEGALRPARAGSGNAGMMGLFTTTKGKRFEIALRDMPSVIAGAFVPVSDLLYTGRTEVKRIVHQLPITEQELFRAGLWTSRDMRLPIEQRPEIVYALGCNFVHGLWFDEKYVDSKGVERTRKAQGTLGREWKSGDTWKPISAFPAPEVGRDTGLTMEDTVGTRHVDEQGQIWTIEMHRRYPGQVPVYSGEQMLFYGGIDVGVRLNPNLVSFRVFTPIASLIADIAGREFTLPKPQSRNDDGREIAYFPSSAARAELRSRREGAEAEADIAYVDYPVEGEEVQQSATGLPRSIESDEDLPF